MEAWYQSWFNSPYYHILYSHRDEKEATSFIKALCSHLKIPEGAKILDLGCGRGRHSVVLNQLGYDVTGIDLSENNIRHAKQLEREGLEFYVHDMRFPVRLNYFDYVLNLFTSFGYFDFKRDDINVLKSAGIALKPGGTFLLDYFNSASISGGEKKTETKNIQGVEFRISKKTEERHVVKDIYIKDANTDHEFQERVRLFSPEELEALFREAGLKLTARYGDYNLSPYTEASDRLILTATR